MSIYLTWLEGCFYHHWPFADDQSWQDKMDVICVVLQPTYLLYEFKRSIRIYIKCPFVEKKSLERYKYLLAILCFKKFQKCIYQESKLFTEMVP